MTISPSLCEIGDAVSEGAENESPLSQTPIGIRGASGWVRPLYSLAAMARAESSSSEQGLDEFHRIERHQVCRALSNSDELDRKAEL